MKKIKIESEKSKIAMLGKLMILDYANRKDDYI